MMTPEQIDAALGALQQQIDDLRADTKPEPEEPTVLCGKCDTPLTKYLCHNPVCAQAPFDELPRTSDATHPDPAVVQLQRAVKQAGERLAALEDNAHTPVENDLSRIQALEQIHADGMPQTSQCTTCGNAPAYLRWREPWPGSRLLCDGCFEGHRTPTAAADFPPIATQEQVAAAYADRFAVAPSLKQRFSDWIDARTAQGIETYGGPLTTDNGRDAERDAFQELLDFCQYQEQSRQEILAANAVLRERLQKLLGLEALPNKD